MTAKVCLGTWNFSGGRTSSSASAHSKKAVEDDGPPINSQAPWRTLCNAARGDINPQQFPRALPIIIAQAQPLFDHHIPMHPVPNRHQAERSDSKAADRRQSGDWPIAAMDDFAFERLIGK